MSLPIQRLLWCVKQHGAFWPIFTGKGFHPVMHQADVSFTIQYLIPITCKQHRACWHVCSSTVSHLVMHQAAQCIVTSSIQQVLLPWSVKQHNGGWHVITLYCYLCDVSGSITHTNVSWTLKGLLPWCVKPHRCVFVQDLFVWCIKKHNAYLRLIDYKITSHDLSRSTTHAGTSLPVQGLFL